MIFTTAFFISDAEILVQNFSADTVKLAEKRITIDQLDQTELNGLFYDTDNTSANFQNIINEQEKYLPIRPLSLDDFQNKNYQYFREIYNNWLLLNNISSLEEIFSITRHLKDLWDKNRDTFFTELWDLIKINWGTNYLKIIYNDIDSEKEQLINSAIAGNRYPQLHTADIAEQKLMESYKNYFNSPDIFTITEFNPKKQEIVAVAHINQGPILIMGKLWKINPIQRALISTIFKGLQKTEI